MITYGVATVWNAAFLDSFLVSGIFEKKTPGYDITKIDLSWTSVAKCLNKKDFMTRAKALTRINTQIDGVKLIRKLFVLDVLKRQLISPENMAAIRKEGKFIIEPE